MAAPLKPPLKPALEILLKPPFKTPQISWHDGYVPIANDFNDPYFSFENGLAETRHVFLAGNNLPIRFCDGFHIGELGFGTGLNLLATWQALQRSNHQGILYFTSFEAFPIALDDMAHALSYWPELAPLAKRLLYALQSSWSFVLDQLHIEIIIGDACQTLPKWGGRVDAWYLDGFSPHKNPELWRRSLMKEVGSHTCINGTFATYSAAGHVRRNLSEAGFEIKRVSGYGRKKHMTIGHKI